MRVLVVNKFGHHVGGVETYVQDLMRMVPETGGVAALFSMRPFAGTSPIDIGDANFYASPHRDFHGAPLLKAKSAARSIYSTGVRGALSDAVDDFLPDLIHFHGTCYQLTPSVASAARARSIPSVVTAHEYKRVCASQRLWDDRAETLCTACVSKGPIKRSLNIVQRRCLRGGPGSSILGAIEQPLSDVIWRRLAPLVHAPSRFMRDVLISDGIEGRTIHYLDLPWSSPAGYRSGASTVPCELTYFGRLSPEKGVDVLLRAWSLIWDRLPSYTLEIFGDGPSRSELETLSLSLDLPRVTFHGRYEISELNSILSGSAMTFHPSVWFENSPYTVRESLSRGVPAVVSRIGGLPEMIAPGAGASFDVGDWRGLARLIEAELQNCMAHSAQLLDTVNSLKTSWNEHRDGLISLYERASSNA